jgi:hypothetical protein
MRTLLEQVGLSQDDLFARWLELEVLPREYARSLAARQVAKNDCDW